MRAENLEEAIRLYELALQVYTREAFPEHWARAQNNLAIAYSDRIRGVRAENLEEAIRLYELALQVRTPSAFPQDCRRTAYSLGRLLYDERLFAHARRALTLAHRAAEVLRGQARREAAKRELSAENADLYARLVACCLLDGDESAAFEFAAAAKGRAFIDLLASARFDIWAGGGDDPELAANLRRARDLRQQIDNLLALLTGDKGPSSTTPSRLSGPADRFTTNLLRDELQALQDQDNALWKEMASRYPALTATQVTLSLTAAQARSLAAKLDATLVEYYRHTQGWCAFVVTPQVVRYVPLPQVDDELLARMTRWTSRIESAIGRHSLSYQALSEWHHGAVAPLREHLPQGAVVLAPFGPLHLLPLAAARDPATGRYLAQDYTLAFAPSLGALRVALQQASRQPANAPAGAGPRDLERLLSVAYPGAKGTKHYLPNVLPEARAIANHFPQATPLHEEDATPNAVATHARDRDVVHLGCHGWFDADRPEQSGLMLAGGWLTVQRIITELRLDQTRLVTLGACRSGRAALRAGEEQVGLTQAMMTAGARTVVASLWSVSDAATRALLEAFYASVAAGHPPAVALQNAARLVREHPNWSHPFYWAAFAASGLAIGQAAHAEPRYPANVLARVKAASQESIQRGESMNEKQTTERIVDDAEQLLGWICDYPNQVLAALDPAGRETLLDALRELSRQAAAVRGEAVLLELADAIQRLVEETPALRNLLLPEGMDVAAAQSQRAVTLKDHQKAEVRAERDQHARECAAQIENIMVEIRTKLADEHRKDKKE